jgi:predicted CXXCH cytochrome family protein
MRTAHRRALNGLLAILVGFAASSCVDERVVERIIEVERDLFDEPAAEALGMLGYSDQESKLTVCGNCHVGVQGEWETSGHADAWAGLQDSGHAQTFCEGCHTVSELGNDLVASAGYSATGEDRYHDVGCESCHGPGLDHALAPEDANIPLARIEVGTDLTAAVGCGECHQGTHHPFMEQWAISGHGNPNPYPAGRAGCNACHEGGGALAAWGVTTTFAGEGELQSITCAVCHDPHGSEYEGQLRFPLGGPGVEVEQNLCSQCHSRRSNPDPNSSHGLSPHSPHTAMLQGEAGYVFPGTNLDGNRIIASHGSEGNTQYCATCHVASATITDAETGEFVFEAVGHSFNAIPCTDADGIPVSGDCAMTTEARDFEAGCTGAGCHSTPEVARGILNTATLRFQDLHNELLALLLVVDPNLAGEGGEIDGGNPQFTVAEGAYFNMQLAAFGGPEDERADPLLTYAHAAAHNPFLMEQLLIISIQEVEAAYPAAAAALAQSDIDLTLQLGYN